MRYCKKCGKGKPFDCFHKDIKFSCGYNSICKECRSLQTKGKNLNFDLPILPDGFKLISEINGLENYVGYAINDNGIIIGCLNANRWGIKCFKKYWRELKARAGKPGYPYITLRDMKIEKTAKVHRLVALSFILNPHNYDQINHKDGNKLNNHISNLEWCNASQNCQHAHDTGLNITPRGERHHNCTISNTLVARIKNMRATGLTHTQIALQLGVSRGGVQYALEKR